MFKVISGLIALAIIAPLGTYVSARILLPDTGLTVPDFSAFFWSFLWGIVFICIGSAIGVWMKS